MCAGESGRLRGSDPRAVGADHGRGGRNWTGSGTGRRRRVGRSSAARDRFARFGAMGIGAYAVGGVSCPRCSDRTFLRLAGAFVSLRNPQTISPPASGGPEHAVLQDGHGHKAEPVQLGIQGTRPNIRAHGTWIEIAEHTMLCIPSISCTRPTEIVPNGAGSHRATAGAKRIKGASAHVRCGPKVPSLGLAASKIPGGEVAFGRSLRPGPNLARPGVGLSHPSERRPLQRGEP